MDSNKIEILIKNYKNGKRETLVFNNVADFQDNFSIQYCNDDTMEILMVTFGGYCLYAALYNKPLYVEQLIGFFS